MAKTLEDYRDALSPADQNVYTHAVRAAGRVFSIHRSADRAAVVAAQVRGTVESFTPNPTAYWTASIGDRYDH